MAHDWAEVRAMMNGTTPAEELRKLAVRNGMNIMNRIPRTTTVIVTRYYANNSNMSPITHDPMTIAQAEKKGLTSTDSGTMRFKLEIVGGEFDGCPACRVNDSWYADTYRRDETAYHLMAGD